MIIQTIEARTHGRYLIEPRGEPSPLLVGFHGHAENAEVMLENLRALTAPAEHTADRRGGWSLLSVQALHRFYTKRGDVVATWMTRQDRELEIADNTAYVWSAIDRVRREFPVRRPLVLAGFSQGVAMAYRAAAAGECDGLIVLAGDVPPDVAPRAASLPPILLGRGTADEWYTEQKAIADWEVLHAAGADVVVRRGGARFSRAPRVPRRTPRVTPQRERRSANGAPPPTHTPRISEPAPKRSAARIPPPCY